MKKTTIRRVRRQLPAAVFPIYSIPIGCWFLLASAAILFNGCGAEEAQLQMGSVSNPTLVVESSNTETSMLVTSENGDTDGFLVRLGEEPLDEVRISITGTDPSEAAVEPDMLTFNSENWESGLTVTVTGVDDNEEDGSQNLNLNLDSMRYDGEHDVNMTVGTLSLVNVDNDAPGLTVIEGTMEFWEHAGRGHFWIVLNTPPDDSVDVTVSCTAAGEALILTDGGIPGTSARLVFTPENWTTPQRIDLIGQDDPYYDGNQIIDLRVSVDTVATLDSTGYLAAPPVLATIKVKDGETSGVDVRLARVCGV